MTYLCYYCDSPATSKEHVPPRCLFPKRKDLPDGIDYRRNLITVPSCDAHNSEKSKDDEYLQLVLIHGYFNNKAGRDHYNSKIVRALVRRPAMLAALYNNQVPVTVNDEPTVSVEVDRLRFNRVLEHVSPGLCVSETGKRWSKAIEIHTPVLLATNQPNADKVNKVVTTLSKAVIDCLRNTATCGDNPDIFWYQLLVDESKERLLCHMVFYGGFDVFAVSEPHLRGETPLKMRQHR